MEIQIPDLSLIVLIGASGSGKSTFARKHFRPTEILSSDQFRAMLSDDETTQYVSATAFGLLHQVCHERLTLGRLTVIDATNVRPEFRRPFLEMARQHHVPAIAIVLKVAPEICHKRNQARGNRNFGSHIVANQYQGLEASIDQLTNEGFRSVTVLDTPELIDQVQIVRLKGAFDYKHQSGPFDIVGDVHGCLDELLELLSLLGYSLTPVIESDGRETYELSHPEGRKLVFVGDLVDRGPRIAQVLRLVMRAKQNDMALCVMGNHDYKLLRKLKNRDVTVSHGLQNSLDQLALEPSEFVERVISFLEGLPYHLIFDRGKLVVAHAGLIAKLQGRDSDRVRAFCLYGDTTGEVDSFGLPIRRNWAADYSGFARVIYGHTPTLEARWLNNTICIDTGCVFGGKLTAVKYPYSQIVSVPAQKIYTPPKQPLTDLYSS